MNQLLAHAETLMSKGESFLWIPELVWLNILPDLFMSISFMLIPLTLLLAVPRTKQVPYKWIFRMFSAVLIGCGLMRMMDILTIWYPYYYTQGIIKVVTAAVSFSTAILLIPLLPRALETLHRQEAHENKETAYRLQSKT